MPEQKDQSAAKTLLKATSSGAGVFAAVNGAATLVAPNPITGGTAVVSSAIAAVTSTIASYMD